MNSKKLFFIFLISICLLVISCSEQAIIFKNSDFYYTVDATKPETGRVYIEVLITNFPSGEWKLYQVPKNTEIKISDFKATTIDGKGLEIKTESAEKPTRIIYNNKKSDVILSYTATPGGPIRHGIQGHLNDEFGLITGDIFLHFNSTRKAELENYLGETTIGKIRVKFKVKEGWSVVSTMTETEEGFDPSINGKWSINALKYSNTGLGKFHSYEKNIGSVLYRIYINDFFTNEEREDFAKKCFSLAEVFNRQAPFDGLPIYTTIVVPRTPSYTGGKSVMGQIWSTGQAYSYDAYPNNTTKTGEQVRRRYWELWAHRISHAINKYEVCGTYSKELYERWFVEGWSSWVEICNVIEAGIFDAEARFDEIYRYYIRIALGQETRFRDEPIYKEKTTNDKALIEYFHYYKAPLITQFLNYEMKRLSEGKKDVNGFIKYVYPKYRNHKANIPLLKELNNYMENYKMDYFFDEYVKKTS